MYVRPLSENFEYISNQFPAFYWDHNCFYIFFTRPVHGIFRIIHRAVYYTDPGFFARGGGLDVMYNDHWSEYTFND